MHLENILEGIRPHVEAIQPDKLVWVAYSGGLDSSVLLNCMKLLRDQGAIYSLKAIHVHHGLQTSADLWVEHCQETCRNLGIELVVMYVDARARPGESPEAVARTARYAAISSCMNNGEYLLTGHHQDDQAETFLLQLMRGSGVNGLSAMPIQSGFHSGYQIRPFLGFSRELLRECAMELDLEWIEDSSNENRDFDRNFIRHEVIPLLRQRWDATTRSISRSATHMAESSLLLAELAQSDMQRLVVADKPNALFVPALLELSGHRQRNVLRYWLGKQGCLMPSTIKLEHVLHDVLNASRDAQPRVAWSGVEIRRYQNMIYLLRSTQRNLPISERIYWDLREELNLAGIGRLSPQVSPGKGIRADLAGNSDLYVGFRQGGEKLQPAGRGHTHELKKLLQEKGIPPWERECLPILYCNGAIVAVPGVCICEGFQSRGTDAGVELIWHPEGFSIETTA